MVGLGEEVARLEMGGGRVVVLLLLPNNKSENDLVTLEVGVVVDVGCFFPPLGGGTADGGGGVAHMLNTHKCNGKHP